MSTMIEHPDITAALRTGWPGGAEDENLDSMENRMEFAKEHAAELVDFILHGDEDLLDRFVEHYSWKYESWLN